MLLLMCIPICVCSYRRYAGYVGCSYFTHTLLILILYSHFTHTLLMMYSGGVRVMYAADGNQFSAGAIQDYKTPYRESNT